MLYILANIIIAVVVSPNQVDLGPNGSFSDLYQLEPFLFIYFFIILGI